jgi:hypothetical protein
MITKLLNIMLIYKMAKFNADYNHFNKFNTEINITGYSPYSIQVASITNMAIWDMNGVTEEQYNSSHQSENIIIYDVSNIEMIIQEDILEEIEPTEDLELEFFISNESAENLELLENDETIVNENTGIKVSDIVKIIEEHIQAKK